MNAHHAESLLLNVTLQLAIIIAAARAGGVLFRFFNQPQVCGEIAAGLFLGPSVFGALFPHAQQTIFNSAAGAPIGVLSQLGLVFVMFLVGLEFDFGHLRGASRTALAISGAGILVPFSLGLFLGPWIHAQINSPVNLWTFTLFVATALSITAMPVLGRIMIEFNMTRTRLGTLTITAAAMDDIVGWFLLALVSAIAAARFHLLQLSLMAFEVLVYLLLMIFIIRPWMAKWVRRVLPASGTELSSNALVQIVVFVLLSAAITNEIGISSVLGAFVTGAILFDHEDLRAAIRRQIGGFVNVFFLPVFFTYTGLRTDVKTMSAGSAWMICLMVILAAAAGKFGACTAVAKLSGLPWREASSIGIMMNTRGLMELIVLNAGYDLGIIPKMVFFIFVIMALVTTYGTSPVLRRLIPGTEVQASFGISQFMLTRPQTLRSIFLRWTRPILNLQADNPADQS